MDYFTFQSNQSFLLQQSECFRYIEPALAYFIGQPLHLDV